MKFRVRFRDRTTVVELTADNQLSTLGDLKTAVSQTFSSSCINLGPNFYISLNGQTPLVKEDCTLSALGMVSGDLIYVLLPSGAEVDLPPKVSLNICGEQHGQLRDSIQVPNASSSTMLEVHRQGGDTSLVHGVSSSSTLEKISCDGTASESNSQENGAITDQEAGAGACCDPGAFLEDNSAMLVDDDEAMLPLAEVNRYLNEPMVVRDSSDSVLPSSVLKTFKEMKPQKQCTASAVLLKVLMNELGYIEEDKVAMVQSVLNWSGTAGLQLNFLHPNVDKAKFCLLLIPMNSLMLIYGRALLEDHEVAFQKLQIRVSDFVNTAVSENANQTFKGTKLPRLSMLFKDTIAYPFLQFSLAASGESYLPTLSNLIFDVQIRFMKYLDVVSLLRLSQVCHQLNDVSKDRSVWRHLYIRDFGSRRTSNLSLEQDWQQMYKEEYILKRRVKKDYKRRFEVYPEHFVRPFPYSIIGGDYDLYPFPLDPRKPYGFPGSQPHGPFGFLEPQPPGPFGFPGSGPLFPRPHFSGDPDLNPVPSTHPASAHQQYSQWARGRGGGGGGRNPFLRF